MNEIYCPYCGKEIKVTFEKGTSNIYQCKCSRRIEVIIAEGYINQIAIQSSFHRVELSTKPKWYKFWK